MNSFIILSYFVLRDILVLVFLLDYKGLFVFCFLFGIFKYEIVYLMVCFDFVLFIVFVLFVCVKSWELCYCDIFCFG